MAAATRPALSSARTQIVRRVPSSVRLISTRERMTRWRSLPLASLVTLTSRICGLSQCRQFCAFGNGADCGEQADHEDAAEGPSVVD